MSNGRLVALAADGLVIGDEVVGPRGQLVRARTPAGPRSAASAAPRNGSRSRGPPCSGGRDLAPAIGEEAERPLPRDAGSSWRTAPAAALRGLTKVFSPFAPRAIFSRCSSLSLEVVAPHVDLAAHFQHGAGASGGQAQRNLPDRADVLRHVLADLAVAAGGGLHQHAVLVAQVDREAVELQFGDVLDRRPVRAAPSSRRTRASKLRAPLASMSVSVRIDSMGTRGAPWRSRPARLPPTRCVGESGVSSSGCCASSACSSRNSRSYSASGISGSSST